MLLLKVILSQRKHVALQDEEGRICTLLEKTASGILKWRCKTRCTCKAIVTTTTRPSEDDVNSYVQSEMMVS
jgi:hypothetical protein